MLEGGARHARRGRRDGDRGRRWGVPVVLDDAGRPRGVEAVVDKDLVAALLARQLQADALLLLTDVDAVYRGFGGDDPRPLAALEPAEAARLIATGEAGAGSMAPKLAAAARFARGGGRAVIASLDGAAAALAGEGGTTISLDGAPGPGVRRPGQPRAVSCRRGARDGQAGVDRRARPRRGR